MLWTYALKSFAEQLNELKVYGDGINTMEKFAVTTTEINPENNHTWVCPVYALYAILQDNISCLHKYHPRSCGDIYIDHSPFNAGSIALVFNPETSHVSPQFHVVFDDYFPRFFS